MKIFAGVFQGMAEKREEAEFKRHVKQSNAHFREVSEKLATLDLSEVPEAGENEEAALADAEATSPAQGDSYVTLEAETTIISRTAPISADAENSNEDAPELRGYVSCQSQGNRFTVFDTRGNTIFYGEKSVATREFLTLSAEDLTGIYGSGDHALEAGLSVIETLIADDTTGEASALLTKNTSLQQSLVAYQNPMRSDALASNP